MKRAVITLAALSLLPAVSTPRPAAQADWPEPTPAVEWIYLPAVPTATPTPPPPLPRVVEIIEYQNPLSEIEILARLLWSSPLRDEQQKENLLWVVFNRISDQSDSFGFDIESVVTQNEFSFYDRHAHLSDENLRIAEETMNEWKSECDGHYVGPHVPENGLYIRFTGEHNRAIEITAERGGEALVW